MELSGGINESTMELFTKNKTSGQFTANLSYNRHIGRSVEGHIPDKLTPLDERLDTAQRQTICQESMEMVHKAALQLALVDPRFIASGNLATLRSVYKTIKRNPNIDFDQLDYKKAILGIL